MLASTSSRSAPTISTSGAISNARRREVVPSEFISPSKGKPLPGAGQWNASRGPGCDNPGSLSDPTHLTKNPGMTYVLTDACIKCKHMDCIEVCPVDCFYEGENMLVIHPDECIDCGVCEPECPPKAIVPDSDSQADKWLKLNTEYSANWPNITRKAPPPA